jgi:hypothetical protein
MGRNYGYAVSVIAACATFVAAAGEAQHVREYFYAGGEYITTSSYQNQMYVEKLTPAIVSQRYPIIFLQGGAQTATVSSSTVSSGLPRVHPLLHRKKSDEYDFQNCLNKPDRGKRLGLLVPGRRL